MDTVTHALVGTAVSDGWFRKRLGPVATPFALVMSALPDVDIFTYFIAPEYAWIHHRGITHSFILMLVIAPLLGYAGYRIARRRGTWLLWSLLAVLCLYCHTLFDLITSWGTRAWMPASNVRSSWDLVPILDVFLTSVTAASFVANRILRWERIDYFLNPLAFPIVHRHPRRQRAANWVGRVAVVLVALYLLIGWQQNRQTVRLARAELATMGVEAVEVRALPIMFTYIAWEIVARDAEGSIYNAVYSSYARGPMRFVKFETLPQERLAPVLATADGGIFAWFTQGMYVASEETVAGKTRITLQDRRFFTLSRPETSRFIMEFDVDEAGGVTKGDAEQLGMASVDIEDEFRRLWELTWQGRDMGR